MARLTFTERWSVRVFLYAGALFGFILLGRLAAVGF
jgi:hypothetical protein